MKTRNFALLALSAVLGLTALVTVVLTIDSHHAGNRWQKAPAAAGADWYFVYTGGVPCSLHIWSDPKGRRDSASVTIAVQHKSHSDSLLSLSMLGGPVAPPTMTVFRSTVEPDSAARVTKFDVIVVNTHIWSSPEEPVNLEEQKFHEARELMMKNCFGRFKDLPLGTREMLRRRFHAII